MLHGSGQAVLMCDICHVCFAGDGKSHFIRDELSKARVAHTATIVVHEDPLYCRSKIECSGPESGAGLGVHVNVCAIGDQLPGVELPTLGVAAVHRLDELNMFLHGLLFHGLWMDHEGLLSSLPGLDGALSLHVYVELPALPSWPTPTVACGSPSLPLLLCIREH